MPIAQSSASGADETAFDFPSPRRPVTTSLGRNRYMLPQPESRRTRPCAGHHRRFDGYDFEAAAPPFRLAEFEGDAVFVYAVSEKADGSLLQDAAECAYFAFRKRPRNIKLATTCECSACDKMQTLDLKFVCHHGEFIKHRTAAARNWSASMRSSFIACSRMW